MVAVYVLIGFAVVVLIAVLGARGAKRQRESLMQFAEERGLTFLEFGDQDIIKDLKDFELFTRGHSPTFSNILTGTIDGGKITLFDYKYMLGASTGRSVYYQTVMVLESEQLNTPEFEIRYHKKGAAKPFQGIELSGSSAFSERYLIRSSDEAWIKERSGQEGFSSFLEQSNLTILGEGNKLLCYSEFPLSPEEVKALVEGSAVLMKTFQHAES